MIIVGRVKFEFGMEDEPFAFGLYWQWDDFCRRGFTDVADRLFSAVDKEDTVLHIDCLELDLGVLTEEEFYEKFPIRLEERLQEALRSLLQGAGPGVGRYAVSQKYGRQLMYYFLHGCPEWKGGEWSFDVKAYMFRVLREEAEVFRDFLLTEGHREPLRKRLVFRLDDGVLDMLVTLTVGGEAVFINRYTGFLLRNYPRLHHYQVPRHEYRSALWILMLAYLWSGSRGYVSRKELVSYTLRGLAAHLGIGVFVLIGYLTQGVEELLSGDPVRHELLEILEEIRYEERLNHLVAMGENSSEQVLRDAPERLLRRIFALEEEAGGGDWSTDGRIGDLRRRLADGVRRREMLRGLKEEEIEWFVKILAPADSGFIVTYARTLEREREKGMYEGKAGDEFRYVKWDFIFAVLLENFSANLDRRQFVSEVLHRLAAHYGLDYLMLVDYFRKVPEELPEWLVGVLGELGEDHQLPVFGVTEKSAERMIAGEGQRIRGLLKRPLSCRRLLGRLSEPEITSLVKRFLPRDQEFILNYAGRLTTAKERGMFEGQAGGEFGRLKWEFIFQLVLTDAFNRKYFALRVLRELAAHYALDVKELLGYFYRYLADEQGGETSGLWETIRELWLEAEGTVLHTELHTVNESDERWMTLERYLLTGEMTGTDGELYALFMDLKRRMPEELRKRIGRIPAGLLAFGVGESASGVRFYAALLLWWLEDHPVRGDGQATLNGMLHSALAGSGKAGVRELRQLLACCLAGRVDEYSGKGEIDFRFAERDFPALLLFLGDFRRKEVAAFVRSRKQELSRLIFSSSAESRKFVGRLRGKARNDRGLADFLKEVFGEEWAEEEECIPVTELVSEDSLRRCLISGRQRQLMEKWLADRRSGLQVMNLSEENPVYQRMWIERTGNTGLRRLADEWLQLERKMDSDWNKSGVWGLLVRYTLPEYANLSIEELYLMFIRKLSELLTSRQKEQFAAVLLREGTGFTLWKNGLRRLSYVPARKMPDVANGTLPDSGKGVAVADRSVLIEVRNAGLVLFSPWFVQLFKRLDFLDEEGKVFVGVEAQIRAVFVLQALVDGVEEKMYEEYELFLNRVLVGLPADEALPAQIGLTAGEKELVCSLADNLRTNWPKMKNASAEGLRQSFLQREGVLEELENEWKLMVSPMGMDVLLDALPWGFSMIRQNWIEKMVRVEWR